MRATTETLSQMTNLLAVVSAPSLNTATIRRIEVLALAAAGRADGRVITSTGGVSKMLATFERTVDPGCSRGRASISTSASSAMSSARACFTSVCWTLSLSMVGARLSAAAAAGLR